LVYPPNGWRYRRLEGKRLGNGKLPKLNAISKKRGAYPLSTARCVGWLRWQQLQQK